MIDFEFKGLDREIKRELRFLDNLGKKVITKAARLTINESATRARTAASKEIRSIWNLKAKDVNSEVRVVKRASGSDLVAIIQGSGSPISLMKFGAKPLMARGRGKKGKGVAVTIQRGRRQRLPSAFIAKASGGNTPGVFQRAGKSRLPIIKKKGITIASMFGQDNVTKVMIRKVEVTWLVRFNHHVDRLMK